MLRSSRTAGVRTGRLRRLPTDVAELCRAVDRHHGHVDLERVDRLTWVATVILPGEGRHPVGVWFFAPPRSGTFLLWRVPVEPLRDDFRFRGLSNGRSGRIRAGYPAPFGSQDPHGRVLAALSLA